MDLKHIALNWLTIDGWNLIEQTKYTDTSTANTIMAKLTNHGSE